MSFAHLSPTGHIYRCRISGYESKILKILIVAITLLTPPPCSSSCLCGEDRASPPKQVQGDTGFQGDTFKQRQPQLRVHEGASLRQYPGREVGGQRRVRFLTRTAVTRWLKLAHREETGSAVEEQKFPLTAAWCSGAGATASPGSPRHGPIGDKLMSTTPGPGLASHGVCLWLGGTWPSPQLQNPSPGSLQRPFWDGDL